MDGAGFQVRACQQTRWTSSAVISGTAYRGPTEPSPHTQPESTRRHHSGTHIRKRRHQPKAAAAPAGSVPLSKAPDPDSTGGEHLQPIRRLGRPPTAAPAPADRRLVGSDPARVPAAGGDGGELDARRRRRLPFFVAAPADSGGTRTGRLAGCVVGDPFVGSLYLHVGGMLGGQASAVLDEQQLGS